jgi:hypothetical protein
MPHKYLRIKEALMKKGKSEDESQSIAAATYVSKGRTKQARKQRAKALQHRKK